MRKAIGLGLVLTLALALASVAPAAQTRYHDFGVAEDISEESEIRLWPRESYQ